MATMIHRTRAVNRAHHERLEQLLSRQDAILRNRRQGLRNGPPTAASGVMDVEERSLDVEEQGIAFSVLELASQTVRGIETALKRLAAGEFGSCSDCGSRISAARLRALPFAALCLVCQQKHDMAQAAIASQAADGWQERVAWTRIESNGQ